MTSADCLVPAEVSGGRERLCGELMGKSRHGTTPHWRLMDPTTPVTAHSHE
ncbi:hypothetical protein [Prosthecobacter sp.]|uniref:hypothetical protein n=1 Tax=Prosthecobacter sp. TaxID=1965333 RepID=UPI003783270E